MSKERNKNVNFINDFLKIFYYKGFRIEINKNNDFL